MSIRKPLPSPSAVLTAALDHPTSKTRAQAEETSAVVNALGGSDSSETNKYITTAVSGLAAQIQNTNIRLSGIFQNVGEYIQSSVGATDDVCLSEMSGEQQDTGLRKLMATLMYMQGKISLADYQQLAGINGRDPDVIPPNTLLS